MSFPVRVHVRAADREMRSEVCFEEVPFPKGTAVRLNQAGILRSKVAKDLLFSTALVTGFDGDCGKVKIVYPRKQQKYKIRASRLEAVGAHLVGESFASWKARLNLEANPDYVGGNDGLLLENGTLWDGLWWRCEAEERQLWDKYAAKPDNEFGSKLHRLIKFHTALFAARGAEGYSYDLDTLDWDIELHQSACRTRGEGVRSKGGNYAAAAHAYYGATGEPIAKVWELALEYKLVFEGTEAEQESQFVEMWGDITTVELHYMSYNYCLQVRFPRAHTPYPTTSHALARTAHLHTPLTFAPSENPGIFLLLAAAVACQNEDEDGNPYVDAASVARVECAFGEARVLQWFLKRHPTRAEINAVLRAVKIGFIDFLIPLTPALLDEQVHVLLPLQPHSSLVLEHCPCTRTRPLLTSPDPSRPLPTPPDPTTPPDAATPMGRRRWSSPSTFGSSCATGAGCATSSPSSRSPTSR